jgi:hypothetical protein
MEEEEDEEEEDKRRLRQQYLYNVSNVSSCHHELIIILGVPYSVSELT